jgi:hypothetical protein
MKTRRFTLKARPERIVVLVPMIGGQTLLSQILSAQRTEHIPGNARVRLLVNRKTGARSLRYEFPA